MKRLLLILLLFFLFFLPAVQAQPLQIYFYGVFSAGTVNKNMLDMTQNLFFTQLQEMDNVIVTDRSSPDQADLPGPGAITSTDGIFIFAEIKEEKASNTWTCTLHAGNADTDKKVSIERTYDSYYKILTGAKVFLNDVFSTLLGKNEKSTSSSPVTSPQPISTSVESIAGTWYGEEHIDKIVILRGGRGFIIYKNGAAMNINVTIKTEPDTGSRITITQAGKPNASFFPDLPRKVALENAPSATPVEWILSMTGNNTLSGQKKTLIADPDSPSGAKEGTIQIVWMRK